VVPGTKTVTIDSARPAPERSDSLPPTGFLLLAGITLFWGANWPMMKIALGEIPVWSFRSLCLLGGGAGLLMLSGIGGRSLRVPRREIGPLMLCAVFNVVGWHLCSGYGVSLIPAGRAVIIAFTMPLWATLLSSLVLAERLTRAKLSGLTLGLAGLAVLIGPDLRTIGAAPLGALMMLGAAVSWATGTVLLKRFVWTIGSARLAGWQLMFGSVPVVTGALLIDGPPALASVSAEAWLATAYIIALPMVFCHWAFFQLVRLFPAALAAIGTLAIPVVGVFSSALVLGESLGVRELSSLILVCGALGAVLAWPVLRSPQRR
jgi:drug/metabolite transporter (DMT)-like permease